MSSDLFFDHSLEWLQSELNFDEIPKGKITYGAFNVFSDAAHRMTNVPAMIAHGVENGPVVGIIAVVHGNELNGLRTIHHLFDKIDPADLKGSIVAIPVVNMYGYLNKRRRFIDNVDLNRVMPGKEVGMPSEVFAYRLLHNVIKKLDFLVDIHTASFGRENSHYVRADLTNSAVKRMAEIQDADIIVHTKRPKGSFRSAAVDLNIPAITIELGNPQMFQSSMVYSGLDGIQNILLDLGMLEGKLKPVRDSVICNQSYWLRVDMGGVLYVYAHLLKQIIKGEEVAQLTDLYGRVVKKFRAPESGIVIGKSTNPSSYTGGRILHLGIIDTNSDFSKPSHQTLLEFYENSISKK